MKYLWIGKCIDDEYRQHVISAGGAKSPSIAQDQLLQGLESVSGEVFDSINAIRVPAYPRYKDFKVPRVEWSHRPGAFDVNVGFYNLKYVGHLFKTNSLVKEAKRWAKRQQRDEEIQIYIYTIHSPFLKAAKAIKKILPKTSINVFVTDLPQFMDLNMSHIKKVLKRIDWVQIKTLLPCVDHYILYSKHMAGFLKLKDSQWTVMEGLINPQTFDSVSAETSLSEEEEESIRVMYSGSCNLRYGLVQLLDAFATIKNEKIELWITGTGNAESLIKERAAKDSRISYFGFLPSRQDFLRLQSRATMMVNMRLPSEKASAYCFPSKLFEYMLSGKPVLTFRIPGIPEEYYPFLIEMPSEDISDIAQTIEKTAQMSEEERYSIGEKAKNFIMTEKNLLMQAKKVFDFCSNTEK